MGVSLIQSHAEFLALKDSWESLYCEDHEAHYFLSWKWLSHLYEQRSDSICILAFEDDSRPGQYLAFLPLRQQLRLSKSKGELYNAYCMGGNYWADYTGIICHPAAENVAIPAFGDYLANMPWRRLFLESLLSSDQRLQLLTRAFDNKNYVQRDQPLTDNNGATNLHRSPGINLPASYENFLTDCLSSSARQKIRRLDRQLVDDPQLRVETVTSESLDVHLDCFRRFWCERWAVEKGDRVESLAQVYSVFLRKAVNSGDMIMLALLDDGKPVSIIACYLDRVRGSLLFFVGARSLEFNRLSSGLLLHALAIKWAIENGFTYYDLLRGDEAYKYMLGARDQALCSLVITAREIAVDAEFLDIRGINQALSLVSRYQRSGRRSAVARLYRQMLESWPNEPSLLRQYADWLHATGDADPSERIRKYLQSLVEKK